LYPRIVLAVLALAAILLLIRWFLHTPPERVAHLIRWFAFGAVLLVLLYLAATGRLHWLFALGASITPFLKRLLPLLRFVPLLRGLYGRYKQARAAAEPAPGQASRVETRFLRMTLDHDSGEMRGLVLEGRFQGSTLERLDLASLLSLLVEYRVGDPDSAALLEAYLDHTQGDAWREGQGAEAASDTSRVPNGEMTRKDAFAILGLEPDADEQAIIDAHRRLIQKLHPDHGGSAWLAAKLNQAKDLLLGK
jgi:hypothetical protein